MCQRKRLTLNYVMYRCGASQPLLKLEPISSVIGCLIVYLSATRGARHPRDLDLQSAELAPFALLAVARLPRLPGARLHGPDVAALVPQSGHTSCDIVRCQDFSVVLHLRLLQKRFRPRGSAVDKSLQYNTTHQIGEFTKSNRSPNKIKNKNLLFVQKWCGSQLVNYGEKKSKASNLLGRCSILCALEPFRVMDEVAISGITCYRHQATTAVQSAQRPWQQIRPDRPPKPFGTGTARKTDAGTARSFTASPGQPATPPEHPRPLSSPRQTAPRCRRKPRTTCLPR